MSVQESINDLEVNNAAKFLGTIYGDSGGHIATFSGKHDGHNNLANTRQQFFPNTPEGRKEAAEYLLSEAANGRDAYHAARTFQATAQRTKEYAADFITTLWSESDEARPSGAVPQPSITVESSPGHYHDYWTLTEPIPSDKAEELNRRIALDMGSDSGWMLSKLLRPPETVNYKRKTPAKVTATYTGATYSPEYLDSVLPQLPQRTATTTSSSDEPPVALNGKGMDIWIGADPKCKPNGDVDKSATLMKMGRVLYDAGANRQTVVTALAERDETLGFYKYTDRPDEYERIMHKLEAEGRNDQAHLIFGSKEFARTDYGNAERFIHRHGKHIRYVPEWGRFMEYDGKRWVLDSPEHLRIKALMKETVRGMLHEADPGDGGPIDKDLVKYALSCESNSRIRAAVDSVKSETHILLSHDDLDTNPWLLNVNNGTIDLRTGELRDHNKDDYITQIAPVDYAPHAAAPVFEKFLRDILPSEAVRKFMQRVVGYSLNGTTQEHKLPILYGTGANGKGTLLNTLLDVFGDYAMQAADELLMARQNSHPTDQADLFRKRFVTNQETEEGQRFNESLIKRMTGGDRIRARRMREDFWQFQPTHTLLLATNHKPIVRSGGNAIWRRLRLVPFTVEIPEEQQDQRLPEKLREESAGVLAWAVRGHMEWLQHGLGEPQEVTDATKDYRDEMDTLGSFIEDMCVIAPNSSVKAQELQTAYGNWCAVNRESGLNAKELKKQLEDRGFERKRLKTGWHYLGLELFVPEEPELRPSHKGEPMNRDEPNEGINETTTDLLGDNLKTVHQGSPFTTEAVLEQKRNAALDAYGRGDISYEELEERIAGTA